MGQKNKKVQTTPTLSEYLAQRAQQVRDSAANIYALKDRPEVPIIPEQNVFSKGLAWLGLSDGTTEDSQKMQIGLKATNGWKPYTLDDILANATRIEQQKQAMEIFEKFAASDDPKIKAFNVLNWKQKPRRVWDAITGRYFVLGAGTVSSASLLNK